MSFKQFSGKNKFGVSNEITTSKIISQFNYTENSVVNNNLDVMHSVTIGEKLDVSGNVRFGETLDVSGDVIFRESLDVSGNVRFTKDLDVDKYSKLNAILLGNSDALNDTPLFDGENEIRFYSKNSASSDVKYSKMMSLNQDELTLVGSNGTQDISLNSATFNVDKVNTNIIKNIKSINGHKNYLLLEEGTYKQGSTNIPIFNTLKYYLLNRGILFDYVDDYINDTVIFEDNNNIVQLKYLPSTKTFEYTMVSTSLLLAKFTTSSVDYPYYYKNTGDEDDAGYRINFYVKKNSFDMDATSIKLNTDIDINNNSIISTKVIDASNNTNSEYSMLFNSPNSGINKIVIRNKNQGFGHFNGSTMIDFQTAMSFPSSGVSSGRIISKSLDVSNYEDASLDFYTSINDPSLGGSNGTLEKILSMSNQVKFYKDIDMSLNRIVRVSNGTEPEDIVNKGYVDSYRLKTFKKSFTTPANDIQPIPFVIYDTQMSVNKFILTFFQYNDISSNSINNNTLVEYITLIDLEGKDNDGNLQTIDIYKFGENLNGRYTALNYKIIVDNPSNYKYIVAYVNVSNSQDIDYDTNSEIILTTQKID
jgi:hypothetical protein